MNGQQIEFLDNFVDLRALTRVFPVPETTETSPVQYSEQQDHVRDYETLHNVWYDS